MAYGASPPSLSYEPSGYNGLPTDRLLCEAPPTDNLQHGMAVNLVGQLLLVVAQPAVVHLTTARRLATGEEQV